MPKRNDIRSILIIGAGPIIIGQACEFDYSGTQACKTLMREGYRVILINSNPATIMTDPQMADVVFIEPITPEVIELIIKKERPDALLPTMGGQTALNCALFLQQRGVLERYGVELIGANAVAIEKAENRELFRDSMERIGLETCHSVLINAAELKAHDEHEYHSQKQEINNTSMAPEDRAERLDRFELEWRSGDSERVKKYIEYAISRAVLALAEIGLPAIVRPSFTLGGTGGGIAYNREEFLDIIERGLNASPTQEILIEESVLGWKEFEMELIRDKKDNCIVVCSIENLDPMGVHTGDSITVAPALTLTDKEYQRMRDASFAVLKEIGVETGGANVQFAVNPDDGRMVVIEMNPRVSRSSALASKATGFPIAKIAALLAVGYHLDEIKNDITGDQIPASFEPSIDYIVTKVPRFSFEKFHGADTTLNTAMKSVGEAMGVGKTFLESLQKALRSLEIGLHGCDPVTITGLGQGDDQNALKAALSTPTQNRLLNVIQAFRMNLLSLEEIYTCCRIDPWFLSQFKALVDLENRIRLHGLPEAYEAMRLVKSYGFSDYSLARLTGKTPEEVCQHRQSLGVRPVFKRIDTCAGEFESPTAYMYSTYAPRFGEVEDNESDPSNKEKIIILGSGPNRIGQGIEFDYCCCHACYALSEKGYETIMVNCNPETVSTDYDTSDKLYFEPLTEEDVLEIVDNERKKGVIKGMIVQLGGQTPLKLARALESKGIPIIGTSPKAIDLAEDRNHFKQFLERLRIQQPKNGIAHSIQESRQISEELGFPFVVRPSYVLGGRGMQIIKNSQQFEEYLQDSLPTLVLSATSDSIWLDRDKRLHEFLTLYPLLFDRFIEDAKEVDVDVIADGKDVFIAGIMEHIEEAGIHSGDSACTLPPQTLSKEILALIESQTTAIAKELGVIGLMNIQFAIKDDELYVLEVNPRASRTVPFVSKIINIPLVAIASCLMVGSRLNEFALKRKQLRFVAVKESVFPFSKFQNVDILLGPEMRSTGEVLGIDKTFGAAFAKSQLGAGIKVPKQGTVFISVKDSDKQKILPAVHSLIEMGFQIVATVNTQRYLNAHGCEAKRINKVLEGRPHIVDAIKNDQIQLIINTTEKASAISDSRSLRRAALSYKVPYYTTISGAVAATEGIRAYIKNAYEIVSLQEMYRLNDESLTILSS